MNITQEEFSKRIYEIIEDKIFFSNISNSPVEVVEKLPEEIVPGKVLFDGLNLFDGIEGIEDDIQQMHSLLKDGTIVNLEDYYTDNGAFDDDGWDRFIAALERLITADEFSQYIDKVGDGSELPYPIDENGHAVIPEGTTEIIEMAFEDCKNLVSVEIPGSVRVINYGAFYGCTGLTSVIIPEGVEEIYDCAFKGCTSLTSVTLQKSIKQVSFDAFDGCPCEEAVMKECEARSIIV
jgi:hypothetical protein